MNLHSLNILSWPLGLAIFALPASTQAPRAVVPDTTHDFGAVRQGEKVSHTFKLRNEGESVLKAELAGLSRPGMAARFSREVAPGMEANFTVEWNTALAKRDVVGTAVLRLNDPAMPEVSFNLKGQVQTAIDVLPFSAVFLSVFRGEDLERGVQIVNNETRPLKIEGVETASSRFTARVVPDEPGKTYQLLVKAKPDAPTGQAQEPLYVITDHPTVRRLPVMVNLIVKPDVFVNPNEVDFGEVSLAGLAKSQGLANFVTQTVLIKTRAADLSLSSVSTTLASVEIRQTPPAGASQTFRLDFALKKDQLKPGPISGSIRIGTSDPRFPEIVIPVRGQVQ